MELDDIAYDAITNNSVLFLKKAIGQLTNSNGIVVVFRTFEVIFRSV